MYPYVPALSQAFKPRPPELPQVGLSPTIPYSCPMCRSRLRRRYSRSSSFFAKRGVWIGWCRRCQHVVDYARDMAWEVWD